MIHEEEYKDFTIDQWIDLFKKSLEEASTDEEVKKYTKALRILNDIKESSNIVNPGEDITDDVFIYIKMISDAFHNVFSSWEYTARQVDNVIVLYNDVVNIDLFVQDGRVHCLVAFGYDIKPPLVSEITKILCDLFGARLEIANNVYYITDIDGDFIWGEDNIYAHLRTKKGYIKVNPVVVFDDETRGNC